MNVIITTFHNPFSFFCVPEEDGKDFKELVESSVVSRNKIESSDVDHGQYVAVYWKNKWVRGIVSMENKFLIWLVDYGIYLRHTDKTVYVNLPPTYKKLPTKVFEASIHGVVPIDRVLSDECEIENQISTQWTNGAIGKAQTLIESATRVYFVPISLMSTEHNDVVIGDLYLESKENKFVNIVNELELWPVFLEKNPAMYIKNLKEYYTSHRKHPLSTLRPAFLVSNIPQMTNTTTIAEYSAMSAETLQIEDDDNCSDVSEDGSTVLEFSINTPKYKQYSLTEADIEKYSNKNVLLYGKRYNALEVLTNKIRDLNMCERYKDHDRKSLGCATKRFSAKSREC